MVDDVRFLIGVEWRLRRQIDHWEGTSNADVFHAWALFELFIARAVRRDRQRYRRFLRRTWWTPSGWWFRRRERQFTNYDALPRYRQFLIALRDEPGYETWAVAALRAVDEDLRPDEAARPTRAAVLA